VVDVWLTPPRKHRNLGDCHEERRPRSFIASGNNHPLWSSGEPSFYLLPRSVEVRPVQTHPPWLSLTSTPTAVKARSTNSSRLAAPTRPAGRRCHYVTHSPANFDSLCPGTPAEPRRAKRSRVWSTAAEADDVVHCAKLSRAVADVDDCQGVVVERQRRLDARGLAPAVCTVAIRQCPH
jgi:hypothetical protein